MTALADLPPWPDVTTNLKYSYDSTTGIWTTSGDPRDMLIAALRARLELATSAMYDICSDLESEYKARSAGAKDWNWLHEQWRIIEACTEPKP